MPRSRRHTLSVCPPTNCDVSTSMHSGKQVTMLRLIDKEYGSSPEAIVARILFYLIDVYVPGVLQPVCRVERGFGASVDGPTTSILVRALPSHSGKRELSKVTIIYGSWSRPSQASMKRQGLVGSHQRCLSMNTSLGLQGLLHKRRDLRLILLLAGRPPRICMLQAIRC